VASSYLPEKSRQRRFIIYRGQCTLCREKQIKVLDSKPGKQKLIGTKPSNGDSSKTSLKSGVQIISKTVVHIDNLGPDCTEALLQDYLLAHDIPVITCYKAKSWLRSDERDVVTAFRVCIPASHRQQIFSPDLWSEGIIKFLDQREKQFTQKLVETKNSCLFL